MTASDDEARRSELLVPAPRQVSRQDGVHRLEPRPTIRLDATEPVAAFVTDRVRDALEKHGLAPRLAADAGEAATVTLGIDPAQAPAHPQAYRLEVAPAGITIVGADSAGLHHGVATLTQWLRVATTIEGESLRLSGVTIEDWPDYPTRGMMLDVSRDKVPTMATLYRLVELLAELKLNQLQLYMEHTFAYSGHERVWRDASPFTAAEIRELDRFCHERGIELVPNQNSFGHMHRWLRHDRYRELAEVPEGIQHPFSDHLEPFSLCPTDPRTLEFLAGLYDELLPNFASRQLNIGCDETIEIGRGRSGARCEEIGTERVYLDYLQRVHQLAADRGHRIQFWGDIIIRKPELLSELPPDAIALEWGYEAGHPFLEHGERFAASGLEFFVCPGTSAWNSLAGRTTNALANIENAATSGLENGATGLLLTDWGDYGHLQPLPVSYPGLVAGAALSWNAASGETATAERVATLLDRHLFADPAGATAQVLTALGDAYRYPGKPPANGSVLFYLLCFAHQDLTQRRFESMTTTGLEATRAHVATTIAGLSDSQMAAVDARQVERELAWLADALDTAAEIGLARLAAGRDAPLGALPLGRREPLAERVSSLIDERRALWLERNRPGGLDDALGRLERTRDLLRGDR